MVAELGLSAIGVPAHRPSDVEPAATRRGEGGRSIAAEAVASTSAQPFVVTIGRFGRMEARNEQAMAAAGAVREADGVYSSMERMLRDAREKLTTIVKQFPPFLTDDPQRQAYLNGFSGLRAQIEALTVPGERSWHVPQLGDIRIPAYRPVIPTLDPATATDRDVAMVADGLGKEIQAVARVRVGLAQQVWSSGSAG